MGDTLNQMATSLSRNNCIFELWDKCQLVGILSRTKNAKDSMFVGPKEETLATFR